ncbi:hypothetical protein E2320_002492 [Naja naja]|nr:hypothetical protein E2320_002492 [Naja naja]
MAGQRQPPLPYGGEHWVLLVHSILEHHQVLKISKNHLQQCHLHLVDYQGSNTPIIGSGKFQVKFQNFEGWLQLIVDNESLPSLLGLDWFTSLGLGISSINTINNQEIKTLD